MSLQGQMNDWWRWRANRSRREQAFAEVADQAKTNKGARQYAPMFSSGQHGRLSLVRGEHARGKAFHIWVLPTDTTGAGSAPSEAKI